MKLTVAALCQRSCLAYSAALRTAIKAPLTRESAQRCLHSRLTHHVCSCLSCACVRAGYVAYNYVVSLGLLKPQKKKTRSTRARGEAPVMTAAEQQDWVSGTPYDQFVKSNAKKATKRTAAQ